MAVEDGMPGTSFKSGGALACFAAGRQSLRFMPAIVTSQATASVSTPDGGHL
jgi:hypothetical protein